MVACHMLLHHNNDDFFCVNILEDQAQWCDVYCDVEYGFLKYLDVTSVMT